MFLFLALCALSLPGHDAFASDRRGLSLQSNRPQGPPPWTLAPGYEVSVSDASVLGQVYRSPDFRKLLVLLEPGSEVWILDLTDRQVRTIKPAALDHTDHGVRPHDDAVQTPAGTFTQSNAEISFKAGRLAIRLLPQPPLVGEVTREELLRRKPDYARAAAAFGPDSVQVARIRKHAKPVEIVAFFGTWCPSCRRWLPQFLRTMELAANPKIKIRYIAVSEGYKEPRAEIDRYDMHLTPSFIIMDGKREVGRIKGKPRLSMERDLAELLAGQ